jgi:hypothetical protein
LPFSQAGLAEGDADVIPPAPPPPPPVLALVLVAPPSSPPDPVAAVDPEPPHAARNTVVRATSEHSAEGRRSSVKTMQRAYQPRVDFAKPPWSLSR